MTPAQLDHLSRIKRHLETLLVNAEKRTPGEWRTDDGVSYFGLEDILKRPDSEPIQMRCPPFAMGKCGAVTIGDKYIQNAAFIASCAGNAEAGWKSTLAVVKGLSNYSILDEDMEEVLKTILTAWPINKLP